MSSLSWYNKTVGSNPLIEAAGLGTAGALAGYYGSGLAANKSLDALMAMTGAKTPQEKAAIRAQMQREGTMRWIKIISALAGGGLGAAYALRKHMDTGSGLKGALSSITNKDYWSKNPKAVEDFKKRHKEEKDKSYFDSAKERSDYLDSIYDSGRGKIASLQMEDPFIHERVPIKYTMDTIQRDPFLDLESKAYTNSIIGGAENAESGVTSSKSIMRSALHAGVGFGSAYAFGNVIGSIFSLPEKNTKRLSNIGGIAGAIVNTGILEKGQ
jgi:hypothetical protein